MNYITTVTLTLKQTLLVNADSTKQACETARALFNVDTAIDEADWSDVTVTTCHQSDDYLGHVVTEALNERG
jgi:hypothetical protein